MVQLSANLGQLLAMDFAAQSQAVILAILLGGGVIYVVDGLMFKRADKAKAAKAAVEAAREKAETAYQEVFLAHTISLEDHAHYTTKATDLAAMIAKLEAK